MLTSPPSTPRTPRPASPFGLRAGSSRTRAFSIIQVMVSLSIGSIVMSFAVPKVKQAERQSRSTIIVADLRTFVTAFEGYAQEGRGWPAESAAGELPAEMADRLGPTGWLRPTPIGGQYNWENNQMHGGVRYRAVISISDTALAPLPVNQEILTEIDTLLDDGNLETGSFRIGVNNDPIYIIQQ